MSHVDEVREVIVARLKTIPGIGVVHPYQRYAAEINRLKALYVSEIEGRQQLRGWYVSRVQMSETAPVVGRRALTCTWVIRGYMALSDLDASEIVFDNFVDAIVDAFRGDTLLDGKVFTTVFSGSGNDGPDVAGIQAPELGPVMFAGVLCHAARLELVTRWFLNDES